MSTIEGISDEDLFLVVSTVPYTCINSCVEEPLSREEIAVRVALSLGGLFHEALEKFDDIFEEALRASLLFKFPEQKYSRSKKGERWRCRHEEKKERDLQILIDHLARQLAHPPRG